MHTECGYHVCPTLPPHTHTAAMNVGAMDLMSVLTGAGLSTFRKIGVAAGYTDLLTDADWQGTAFAPKDEVCDSHNVRHAQNCNSSVHALGALARWPCEGMFLNA